VVTRPVRHFAGVLLALSLAACGNAGGPGTAPRHRSARRSGGRPAGRPPADGGGRAELALKAYLRAAAEDGLNVDTLSAIGSANLALGRLGQAEQILRRALEIDPNFVPALNNLGVRPDGTGKIGEARVVFQQAYALDSGETDSIRENLKLAIARTESPCI
jgi:tetratricopeptide (TPR) repeat protein